MPIKKILENLTRGHSGERELSKELVEDVRLYLVENYVEESVKEEPARPSGCRESADKESKETEQMVLADRPAKISETAVTERPAKAAGPTGPYGMAGAGIHAEEIKQNTPDALAGAARPGGYNETSLPERPAKTARPGGYNETPLPERRAKASKPGGLHPVSAYIEKKTEASPDVLYSLTGISSTENGMPSTENLSDILTNPEDSFQKTLLRLIDERNYTDVEVYKRANMDRKLFSKIRSNSSYNPTKKTALALAVALRLDLDATMDLLGRAGLALSHSSKFDLIVEYCIKHSIYDMFEINALLYEYNEPVLG